MPRPYIIKESPNPTGLTVEERRLALDVLRSMEDSVNRERARSLELRWSSRDWTVHEEAELRARVYKAAYNQLTGRVKSEGSVFRLVHNPATTQEDMDYVLESLGVKP